MNSTALRRLIYTELLLAVREPAAMFMSVVLPLAIFLVLGFSVGSTEIEVTTDSGVVETFHVRDVLLAGNIAWVTAIFGVIALPQGLVEFRQHGVFRRFRVTPMPSHMLIIAPIVVGAAVILASLALMLVVGWQVFDIRFAGNVAMIALAIFVSYLAFAALGTAITARIRNVRTALGLGLALFGPHVRAERILRTEGVVPHCAPHSGRLAATHALLRSAHLSLAGWDMGGGDDSRHACLGILHVSGRVGSSLHCRQRTTIPVGLEKIA